MTCYVIDGSPTSEKIYRWFADLTASADMDSIEAATALRAPGIPHQGSTAAGFLRMAESLLQIACGLAGDPQAGPEPFLDFTRKPFLRALTYWCLTEGHAEEARGDLEAALWDAERSGTNRNYDFRMYYIYHESEARFAAAAAQFAALPAARQGRIAACSQDNLRSAIRLAYRGDLDGFILDAIAAIQFRAMGKAHEKLAQVVRMEKMGITCFDDDELAPYESWRFLYPNYFDGAEDSFDAFFRKFPGEAVLFYLEDYVQDTFGVTYLPYNRSFCCARTGRRSSDISDLLSFAAVRTAVSRKYGRAAAPKAK
ncbi:Hypothetical Protein FCC1311_048552 [Hondaea fermentalgiana]|uniref:Uncharacterized protein n=1 Tax=Hondaea fermentalgiana TaxID=2315210 RepID=A0A2R5GL84_9STRA|nr:Hypothetical Protein FCC1311_048552 [Hondaea fermentalgiana]|eukprot:GBG28634.1 Hypothetical Protein FCC1311_048552 [Hondaea fermentalgiana]